MARGAVRRRPAARRPAWVKALIAVAAVALAIIGWRWLVAHPQHNPWAALDLDDPVGWATAGKLTALQGEPGLCRPLLTRAGVRIGSLPPAGVEPCRLADRTIWLADDAAANRVPLSPAGATMTCPVAAALSLWIRDAVQPAAMTHLGRRVIAIEHLGTTNCRRIGGGSNGQWSEHATGNAIDIAAFRLSDGRRVTILSDWDAPDGRSAFLRAARDGACRVYATTLSPDYNAAHRDHLHLDMGARITSVCR